MCRLFPTMLGTGFGFSPNWTQPNTSILRGATIYSVIWLVSQYMEECLHNLVAGLYVSTYKTEFLMFGLLINTYKLLSEWWDVIREGYNYFFKDWVIVWDWRRGFHPFTKKALTYNDSNLQIWTRHYRVSLNINAQSYSLS